MAQIGYAALLLTLIAGVYSAVIVVWGRQRRSAEMIESGKRGMVAAAVLCSISVLSLLYLVLTNDFRYQYVYETTSTFQPLAYHISALWQGQSGSILFWLWTLSLLSLFFILLKRNAIQPEFPYEIAILAALEAFFALLLLAAANPFAPAVEAYTEGFGGNPLLENPGMIYHPPTVLIGYAATAIPFAAIMGRLLAGMTADAAWLRNLRPWVLLSWLLLGVGILLGAQWAYVELGWGGYWAWDPVENASLIPWLINTAFLHALIMQERRGMFKLWNAILASATFLLCIFATWVTRGGAVRSVHAFGASSVGDFFLGGLIVLTIFSVWVIVTHRKQLKSDFEIQALGSREAAFLYTTLLFVAAAGLVLLGTVFPALSEAITGQQIAWGAESFDQITRILTPFLLVLLGVCPILGWRRTEGSKLLQSLLIPIAVALIAAAGVILLSGGPTYAALAFGLVSFVAVTILAEFYEGWRLRLRKGEGPLRALLHLITYSHRRYGGYLVHLGVLLMVIGITGQSLYQTSQQVALNRGESVTVGSYKLQYVDSGTEDSAAKRRFHASLQVYRNGQPQFSLEPERNYHYNVEQWVTEIALRSNLAEDLYVMLLGLEDNGLATFEILINPLISWLWLGGVVVLLGTVLAVLPLGRRSASPAV